MTVMDTRPDLVARPGPGAGRHLSPSAQHRPGSRPSSAWPSRRRASAVAVLGHLLVPQVGRPDLGDRPGRRRGEPRAAAADGDHGSSALVTKKLLRVGIVLLGFSVSFASITALGLPLIAIVAGEPRRHAGAHDVARAPDGPQRSSCLLIGTGFSICGASAIAGMEDTAGADEEDVTVSIAMVTLFGTLALVLLPLLQGPLGPHRPAVRHLGRGQRPRGRPGGGRGQPRRRRRRRDRGRRQADPRRDAGTGRGRRQRHPADEVVRRLRGRRAARRSCPCSCSASSRASRSAAPVRARVRARLDRTCPGGRPGAALFGMGCSVKIASLFKGSGAVMVVSAIGTLFIAATSLAGILL